MARRPRSRTSRFPTVVCCETFLSTAGGYCGQQGDDGTRQYALCHDPSKHFYWDNVHPTQAAWAAVAETFRPKIREFLSNSFQPFSVSVDT